MIVTVSSSKSYLWRESLREVSPFLPLRDVLVALGLPELELPPFLPRREFFDGRSDFFGDEELELFPDFRPEVSPDLPEVLRAVLPPEVRDLPPV